MKAKHCLHILLLDCIGANGSGRRTVVELSHGDYPYGIAITENSIIWTDWRRFVFFIVQQNKVQYFWDVAQVRKFFYVVIVSNQENERIIRKARIQFIF